MERLRKDEHYVLGADFGTDSVRVVAIDAADGSTLGSYVSYYPRWKQGLYSDPRQNRFRQHPLDYIESFQEAVQGTFAAAPRAAALVRGICIDTTGCTPSLCDEKGVPLAMQAAYADNPDAMFILWKDHTAVKEADDINDLSRTWGGEDYTQYVGGIYSSEWLWSKMLHVVRTNPALARVATSVVEHCDWFPALLCGTTALDTIKRSRCAAGHKILWHASWGGYPPRDFFDRLDPFLGDLRDSMGAETYTADVAAGHLQAEWAARLGLPQGIPVCVGAYDAHIGAVGGNVAVGVMVMSIGTSTCDITIAPRPAPGEKEALVEGICGQVDGSVVPGWIGYEAGQSAYGDYYAWLRDVILWPLKNLDNVDPLVAAKVEREILPALERAAASIEPTEESPVALDWINGRRTPYADQLLTGALTGLSLGTDAPALMRMLLESTAFGARAILECFERQGIATDKVIAIGGVARKSPVGMQILADVTNRDIQVTSNDLAPAIGAAVFASVVAGLYPDVPQAQKALCGGADRVYAPDPKQAAVYDKLYAKYQALGAFEERQRRGR